MAKTCIGLDLGSSAIKMAQLIPAKRHGGQARLVSFGIEALAGDSIVDGTIMNHGAVVDAIRELAAF